MLKFPSDVSVAKNCIDVNFETIERRDPDNFPRFLPQEWCAWRIPEIALKSDMEFRYQIIVNGRTNFYKVLRNL